MPIITVKVSTKKSAEMTKAISETLLELTSRVLRKNRDLTAVVIDYVEPENWLVGGKTLVEHGKSSIYFDVKIVDETNTKQEKAQYVAEAFAAFTKLLGPLHEESYIYVQDVRPAAYGYGGETQEYRYHH
ncbi:MAG: 4-oxalocrotonate tautomerase family protein [Desulfobulbaceae bacterium]|nr:4-oxalocrotonate tautomerase family protein [Desulfobulbaceae bacterium]